MSFYDINPKELIIFDLDGTLAPSRSRMKPEMAIAFEKLLRIRKVAVISGGTLDQFQKQFLGSLPESGDIFKSLFLLPTSGTSLYAWEGSWKEEYREGLTAPEREKIISAFGYAFKDTGYQQPQKIYGDVIEDRGSQVTFSALGQQAPLPEKSIWDPDGAKRHILIDALSKYIPEFDLGIGGTTSIDITKKGVNKAFGIEKLSGYLYLPKEKMLYLGDKVIPGGNDYPVKECGVDCIQVDDEDMTCRIIEEWVTEKRA